jgi:hypothetical protein
MQMALELRALLAVVHRGLRERAPATLAELQRAVDRLAAMARQAGLERQLLLDAAAELPAVERLLRALTDEHRRLHGRSHAVREAEATVHDAQTLRFEARPMGHYVPDEYLRTRLWTVIRGIERARIALQWERMERAG